MLLLCAHLAAPTLAISQSPTPPTPATLHGKPGAVVLSDIGNKPHDQMSLVRLLLYSNEIDLKALIATTSTCQKTAVHLTRTAQK